MEGGREGGSGKEREGERRRERENEEGRGREKEHEGVNVGQNTRTCGLWDTYIQQYIITSSSP